MELCITTPAAAPYPPFRQAAAQPGIRHVAVSGIAPEPNRALYRSRRGHGLPLPQLDGRYPWWGRNARAVGSWEVNRTNDRERDARPCYPVGGVAVERWKISYMCF